MPMSRVPRKLLTSWVEKPCPVGSPQMTWGRALNKALRAAGVPSTFTKWRDLAAYRHQWRVLCGAKARGTVHTPPKHPRDIWAQPGRRWPTALQASGETALQKHRHTGTLKQAGLGVWGMRQHGESTRSCERAPPNKHTPQTPTFPLQRPMARDTRSRSPR